MNIRMLKTENGSVDGIKAAPYLEGAEYDLTNTEGERDLATAFINAGMAEEVKANGEPENKATEPAQNKSTRKRG